MDREGITCLKWLLFAGNMILWLFGIGVLVFAMWLWFDTGNTDAPEKLDEHLSIVSSDLNYYYAVVWILIVMGLIILFCGLFGWLGAYRESDCMLTTFAVVIGIVFVSHILAAALGFSYRFQIQTGLSSGIQTVVRDQYGDDLPEYFLETQVIDYIQRRFNCCGGVEYEDWASSRWRALPEHRLDEIVPASCCYGTTGIDSFCPTYSQIIGGKNPYLHQTGCGTKLKRSFLDYIVGITIGGFTTGLLELTVCIMTMVLIHKLRKEDKRIY